MNINLMPKHSLVLNNEIMTLNESTEIRRSMGFIIKHDSKHYIISTHHYLPIVNTNLNTHSKKIKLIKIDDINWNELNIFETPDFKYLLNTTIIKNIKTRFLEPKTIVKMEIGEEFGNYKKINFESIDYITYFPNIMSDLRNIYLRFYMGKKDDYSILDKLRGLSGSPVLSKDDSLIGIFTKYEIVNDDIYGWALPSIYLTKSLTKKNNKDLYFIKHLSYENIKIGQYEVQKENSEYFIYYPPINTKIPLDIYFYIEGDENKSLTIKDNIKNEIIIHRLVKNENFDISLQLQKKDNKFKLNHGLFSLLFLKNYNIQIQKIVDNYKNQKLLNDIWISFNDTIQIDLEKLKI